jgi:predicted metal-dependent TIM-barrel fold hydrolase
VSVPLAVPYAALEMRRRGWSAEKIDSVIYGNPVRFMSQTEKFKLSQG